MAAAAVAPRGTEKWGMGGGVKKRRSSRVGGWGESERYYGDGQDRRGCWEERARVCFQTH